MTLIARVRAGTRDLADYDALALVALVWFAAKFLRYSFPPLFPTFTAQYGVSNATLGTAFSAMMLVYAAMQFPSGALADRLGAVRVIVAGAVVAASGALLLVAPVPFAVLVVGMVLVGLGTGVHKTVAVGLLAVVYPARTGRTLGIMDTVGAFGGVVAPAAVVLFVGGLGWHMLYLVSGAVGLCLAVAFAIRVPKRLPDRDRTTDDDQKSTPFREYLRCFTDPRFSAFILVTIGFGFAYNGAVAFLPLYLTDAVGLDAAFASALYSAFFLVSVVQVLTGDLSDRFGQLPVILGTLALATVGLGSLLLSPELLGPFGVAAATVAFGLGSHGFRPVRGAYLMAVIPESVSGGTLGVVRTILMGAGAVSPAVVGFVSEYDSFRTAFGVLLASYVVATAITALLLVVDQAETGR